MSKTKPLEDYVSQGQFYKAVVEDGSDIILVVDFEGNILYHNPSVEDTLGYAPGSLIGENFFRLVKPETLNEVKKKFIASTKKPYTEGVEFLFLCADQTYKYLEFNAINIKQKEGIQGLILDCRDMTQRKKDAEELLRAQKAKEQFLANMSHEIRTPINGIAGMAQLLSESDSKFEREKYIAAIKNSVDNLKVIINDILDLSIIESGKIKLERVGFDIRYQLMAVIDTFVYQTNEKGIKLKYDIDPSIDKVVIGDPVRLNQVLINLISNAVKFTHQGEINVSVKTKKKDLNKAIIEFAVSDTGVGIPPEKFESIFDSFSQADESVTRKYGGTGLGLTISRQLVEIQEGKITVKSKEGKGTTFTFYIPYELGAERDLVEKDSGSRKYQQFSYSGEFDGMKLLLVEDNDINRLYAANVLKKWNCELDTAENGFIALEKLRKKDYDVILMDVQMPVMDGYEATRTIRGEFPKPKSKTPIIALTANAIKGDNEKCIALGMNDYIPKPFVPEDLFRILLKFRKNIKRPKTIISDETSEAKKLVDLSYLRNVSNNDENFIKEMIDTFLKNIPVALEEAQKFSEEKNWHELGRTIHRIKPSITFMGITNMKERVTALEALCSQEPINENFILLELDHLLQTCTEALNELRQEVI